MPSAIAQTGSHAYWQRPLMELLSALGTSPQGRRWGGMSRTVPPWADPTHYCGHRRPRLERTLSSVKLPSGPVGWVPVWGCHGRLAVNFSDKACPEPRDPRFRASSGGHRPEPVVPGTLGERQRRLIADLALEAPVRSRPTRPGGARNPVGCRVSAIFTDPEPPLRQAWARPHPQLPFRPLSKFLTRPVLTRPADPLQRPEEPDPVIATPRRRGLGGGRRANRKQFLSLGFTGYRVSRPQVVVVIRL